MNQGCCVSSIFENQKQVRRRIKSSNHRIDLEFAIQSVIPHLHHQAYGTHKLHLSHDEEVLEVPCLTLNKSKEEIIALYKHSFVSLANQPIIVVDSDDDDNEAYVPGIIPMALFEEVIKSLCGGTNTNLAALDRQFLPMQLKECAYLEL